MSRTVASRPKEAWQNGRSAVPTCSKRRPRTSPSNGFGLTGAARTASSRGLTIAGARLRIDWVRRIQSKPGSRLFRYRFGPMAGQFPMVRGSQEIFARLAFFSMTQSTPFASNTTKRIF